MLKLNHIILLAALSSVSTPLLAADPVVTPAYSMQITLDSLSAPNIIPGFTAVSPPAGSLYPSNLYAVPSSTINLGDVNIGTKLSRVLAVQNVSGKPMSSVKSSFQSSSSVDTPLSSIACTPPLTVTSATPGEVCDMIVSITPTVAGVVTFSIKASAKTDANELGETTFNFVANVIDPNGSTPPGITLNPSLVEFSSTVAGESSLASILVHNSSSTEALLDLSASVSGANFSISSSDCGVEGSTIQLAGGATCQVSLSFSPTSAGSFVGTLTLDASNSSNGTQSSMLTGTATSAPVVDNSVGLSVALAPQDNAYSPRISYAAIFSVSMSQSPATPLTLNGFRFIPSEPDFSLGAYGAPSPSGYSDSDSSFYYEFSSLFSSPFNMSSLGGVYGGEYTPAYPGLVSKFELVTYPDGYGWSNWNGNGENVYWCSIGGSKPVSGTIRLYGNMPGGYKDFPINTFDFCF